jgi:hypothetical protein
MLYTCSVSAAKRKTREMKHYFVMPDQGNDEVAPDKRDIEFYKNGTITAKGFALNYEMKLRSQEAYKWMARVSAEASHEDIVLIGEDDQTENSPRKMLAEIMFSMFGGRMNFRYAGEL